MGRLTTWSDIKAVWRLAAIYVAVAVFVVALAPFVLAEWLSVDSVEGGNGS